MFRASVGGGAATVYRHALVRIISGVLGPITGGFGWSPAAVAIAGVLMSWDPAPTLAQRFEAALGVLDAALPRRRRTGRTFQGLVKAMARHSHALLITLAPRLRACTRRAAGRHWRVGSFVPIGVDGSRFDAPRTIANEPLGFAGKAKCSPQMMAVLLVHLGSMLPWDFGIGGAHHSERSILRRLIGRLPDDTLLVADAGYTGFELLSHLRASGVSFLVRVGRGIHLLSDLGDYRREGRDTVYLWPAKHRHRPPLRLRLIRVGEVWLITDVADPRRLSRAAASELYRRRWGLEVAFRSLKQTLERRKVRSCAAPNATRELAWSIVGLWVLALIGARAIRAAGHAPDRLSIAGVLGAMRSPHAASCERTLRRRLRAATRDTYRRRSSKKAYDRARKKTTPPPGTPVVTRATASQVADAAALRAENSRT
jgi:Transposase DDE domain